MIILLKIYTKFQNLKILCPVNSIIFDSNQKLAFLFFYTGIYIFIKFYRLIFYFDAFSFFTFTNFIFFKFLKKNTKSKKNRSMIKNHTSMAEIEGFEPSRPLTQP